MSMARAPFLFLICDSYFSSIRILSREPFCAAKCSADHPALFCIPLSLSARSCTTLDWSYCAAYMRAVLLLKS